MLRELAISSKYYHDHYTRRHIRLPEPLERTTRHDLRRVLGKSLIHLGERLVRVDHVPDLNKAA